MLGGIKSTTEIILRTNKTTQGLIINTINSIISIAKGTGTKSIYFSTRCNCAYSNYKIIMSPLPVSPGTSTATATPKKPVLLTISVDGNISSGKSTLVSSLTEMFPKDFNYDVQIVPEPLEKWTNLQGHNLLGMLYQDTTKNNFLFQHYVQLTRLVDTIKTAKQLRGVSEGFCGKIRILERSLQNNRYCFSELAKRQGTLHEAEFSVLAEWYKWLEQHVDLSLDLIIYLRTSPQVVFDRMKGRGRAEESIVPFEYLSDLHETYEDWLVRRNIVEENISGPGREENGTKGFQNVIVVDANKSKEEVANQTRQLIEEFLTSSISQESDKSESETNRSHTPPPTPSPIA